MIEQAGERGGAVNAKEIVGLLRQRHTGRGNFLARDWLFIPELRLGTGYGRNNEQRIDAWTMHMTGQMERIAYEVKVSRSDLLSELKNCRKRTRAMLVSNQFYFVVPEGLMSLEELPADCGLYEVRSESGLYLDLVEVAPWRDTRAPTWRFMAAVTRRVAKEAGG